MSNELKDQFTSRKNELIAMFATAQYKVSLTSDIWTAGKHGLSYICVTAHYLDDNWKLQKRILSFRVVTCPHTGDVVFNAIVSVMIEFNLKNDLQNKVFSISFDNASNNTKAIEYFLRSFSPIANGAFFHQKCACHVLNLTVKAGLKTPGCQELLTKFKKAVTHIFSNGVRKQRFHDLCTRMQLSKLRVPWDVETRWNSTYRMLKRCFPYANTISVILNESPEGIELALGSGEWAQLHKIMNFLEVFFKATVALSFSYKPTAHELLHHLYRISQVYREMQGTFFILIIFIIFVYFISVLY